MCGNILEKVSLRRVLRIICVFQETDRPGLCLWKVTWPTYKARCAQRITYRESILLRKIGSRKNVQKPAFMTASRSYLSCILVAERRQQNELLTRFIQMTVNWMEYVRQWMTFLHVFYLSTSMTMNVYERTDFENYQCLLKERVRRQYQICTKETW